MTTSKTEIANKITEMGDSTNYAKYFLDNALEVGTVINGFKLKGQTIIGYEIEENSNFEGTPHILYVTKEGGKSGWQLITKSQK